MIEVFYDVKKITNIICNEISLILKEKEYVVLALPGGRSVKTLYNEFEKHDEINWNKVHIFLVDERLVKITNSESNFKLINDQFLGSLIKSEKIKLQNLHPFILDESKEDKGLKEYNNELQKFGGSFDIVVLGVGEDGHVGGLFPNYTIDDNSENYILFDKSPKLPNGRMSASRKLIEKSRLGIALFIGDAKKKAYEDFLDSSIKLNDCPVKILHEIKKGYILTNISLE